MPNGPRHKDPDTLTDTDPGKQAHRGTRFPVSPFLRGVPSREPWRRGRRARRGGAGERLAGGKAEAGVRWGAYPVEALGILSRKSRSGKGPRHFAGD
eukprot:gene13459-biopygen12514